VAAARQDEVKVEVTGLDQFDVKDLGDELENAQRLRALEIHSGTFERELHKKLALKFLDDSSQAIKNQIVSEIDTGQ